MEKTIVTLTLAELEAFERNAHRGNPTAPNVVLQLAAYLRNVLQEKENAQAVLEIVRPFLNSKEADQVDRVVLPRRPASRAVRIL